jgi:hypothetical protein
MAAMTAIRGMQLSISVERHPEKNPGQDEKGHENAGYGF